MNEAVIRPWGTYQNLLDTSTFKVKVIKVTPGNQPSYQYHHKRAEHWVVVEGTGSVTVEGIERNVSPGDYVFVPLGFKHRIKNTSESLDLVFIEVQTGTYFGEDDIVRLEDDFGRN